MSQWKILQDICYLTAIDKNSLNRFVGRKELARSLEAKLSSRVTIVIEGDVGVGKTSFGNYARFKTGQFSPNQEVIVDPSWDRSELLINLITAITTEVAADKDLRFQLSAPHLKYDEFEKK
jgi:MoxR-like ATPase